MKLPLPLSSTRRDEPASTGRLVNVMSEPSDRGPRLVRAPGVRSWRTFGNGPVRGLHVMNGGLYVVSGESLYDAAGSELGEIPGTGLVSIADNGTSLVVAAGGNGYSYSGTVAAISDPDFPGAVDFGFLDGYLTFVEPNSGRFMVTDLYSTAIDALKFATAEGLPDNLVGHIVDHREVILFGPQSTERWYNSGADNFPLERSPSGFMELGARGGWAKLDNSVFWAASDNTIRRLAGAAPARVSTHALEGRIAGYTGTPQGFAYTLDGHLCYVVSWNEATWVYDVTTGTWHERSSYLNERWRASCVAAINGTTYVGDRDSGAVGIMDATCKTEFGERIVAGWQYPPVSDGGRRLVHSRLELQAEIGVGNVTGETPTVMLEWSDDGGRTWSFAPTATLGSMGRYKDRIVWHRLGSARERVYRVSVSEAVDVNVYGTELDAA